MKSWFGEAHWIEVKAPPRYSAARLLLKVCQWNVTDRATRKVSSPLMRLKGCKRRSSFAIQSSHNPQLQQHSSHYADSLERLVETTLSACNQYAQFVAGIRAAPRSRRMPPTLENLESEAGTINAKLGEEPARSRRTSLQRPVTFARGRFQAPAVDHGNDPTRVRDQFPVAGRLSTSRDTGTPHSEHHPRNSWVSMSSLSPVM